MVNNSVGGGAMTSGFFSQGGVNGPQAPTSGPGAPVNNLESLNASLFAVVTSPGIGQITLYGGTEEQLSLVDEVIKKFDKRQPQAYVEISIIELSEDGTRTF